MRTVILSHPYQACWTIINSPWLPAGQEPVSVQHWLQHRSPLTWHLKSAGWWRALRGRGPLLQKKSVQIANQEPVSVSGCSTGCLTQSPAACKIGKAAPEEGSHCWSTKHCDQLQKGFEQWTSCQGQTGGVSCILSHCNALVLSLIFTSCFGHLVIVENVFQEEVWLFVMGNVHSL